MSKFTWQNNDIKVSICSFCKHKTFGERCKAFSNIPDEILSNDFDHRKKHINDNGLQFEPNKGVSAEDIDRLFE